jgi:hypothetical protein
MSIGMGFLQEDITQSMTNGAAPIVNDFGTDHDQSVRRLVGSSIRESRSTARWPTMPRPTSLTNSILLKEDTFQEVSRPIPDI